MDNLIRSASYELFHLDRPVVVRARMPSALDNAEFKICIT